MTLSIQDAAALVSAINQSFRFGFPGITHQHSSRFQCQVGSDAYVIAIGYTGNHLSVSLTKDLQAGDNDPKSVLTVGNAPDQATGELGLNVPRLRTFYCAVSERFDREVVKHIFISTLSLWKDQVICHLDQSNVTTEELESVQRMLHLL